MNFFSEINMYGIMSNTEVNNRLIVASVTVKSLVYYLSSLDSSVISNKCKELYTNFPINDMDQ